jgi:small subunit ribosomal protein S4e
MHQKTRSIPTSWPIPRKNRTYIICPKTSQKMEFTLPLVVIMRDMLQLVGTSKEAKKAIDAGEILVNNKVITEDKLGFGLFDLIYVKKLDKTFTILLTKTGKLYVPEIPNTKIKLCQIVGKKVLNKGKSQINLSSGINVITEEKMKVGDSVLLDTEKNKIVKTLPIKKDASVLITAGKWKGNLGQIEEVQESQLIVKIEKSKTNLSKNHLFVLDKEHITWFKK